MNPHTKHHISFNPNEVRVATMEQLTPAQQIRAREGEEAWGCRFIKLVSRPGVDAVRGMAFLEKDGLVRKIKLSNIRSEIKRDWNPFRTDNKIPAAEKVSIGKTESSIGKVGIGKNSIQSIGNAEISIGKTSIGKNKVSIGKKIPIQGIGKTLADLKPEAFRSMTAFLSKANFEKMTALATKQNSSIGGMLKDYLNDLAIAKIKEISLTELDNSVKSDRSEMSPISCSVKLSVLKYIDQICEQHNITRYELILNWVASILK
jgi:hypothetical protein